ncbi:inositol polyphosphate-4-phosphatase type I A-like isoform X2 [Halichondria panicea]|uniref:inositol polyphosphate-4-phosphatase type I A-like isoform X2 n=1 Tax=Halichondria panicea TaxID=6063 RepID=UPI00312B73F7
MSSFLSKMKFNDKELAKWSTMFTPDKEGLLEKKGAGKGQGYKQRWFRLKGNLLFYFKVDDCGGWEKNDPVGVIVLERVHVDRVHNETRPYSFVLQFENDDSRTYFLSAHSEVELESWIITIKMSSYETLKATLYQLQNKIMGLTGQDPLKDKGVSIIGSQVLPSKKLYEKDARRTLYARSSNKERAQKLQSLTNVATVKHMSPKYELSLSCCNLPTSDEGNPPSTMVRVQSYTNQGDTTALATLSHTDVIESSVSPCYSHLVLLDLGPSCPLTGVLEFEVFSVNHTNMEMGDCTLDGQEECLLEGVGNIIGIATCNISSLTESTTTKELKLPLSQGQFVCGFLVVNVTQVSQVEESYQLRRNALVNRTDKDLPGGVLPNILTNVTRCHFSFPSSKTEDAKLKVFEEMYECVFNIQVPIELLKCYNREDIALLKELNSIGALGDKWLGVLREYQAMLHESIQSYSQYIGEMENLGETCGFKRSTVKRDETLQFIPCNLHLQRMRVQSSHEDTLVTGERTYNFCTFGCPADHGRSFKNGGLRKLLSECRSSPSFICKSTEGKASSIKQTIAKLAEIRTAICKYNSALYSATADAKPTAMNEAVTAISKQIQNLFWMMETKIVKEAVEGLIVARPGNALSTAPPTSKDAKRMSMKRQSIAVVGKCTCGKCLKCVPSPSDWLWNGSRVVQISSKWMMSDSISSIQNDLVKIVGLVESATLLVVDQQHLAVASEIGIGLGTFKPTYVWSNTLIPEFSKLKQTVEGLFRVATTSLSFALVQLDSYVKELKALKLRRDVVFSQALTSLVTSFYTSISQNFTDPSYLRQIRKIGFLAQFESLLSSAGDESGMLEDMCVAVAELACVKFQLLDLRSEDGAIDFQIKGTRDSLVVQFLIAPDLMALLPDKAIQSGELISVVPVLFTQGVNEKQTFAHIKHDLNLTTSLQLQDEINSQSLDHLCCYVKKFLELVKNQQSSQAQLRAVRVEDLLSHLKKTYSTHKSKNIELLVALHQLVHWVRGGRMTSCKSGKDRTSMSVTLEECCMLRNNHHLPGSEFVKTLSTLRSHGTRLENCLKNTGHRCYHFNQLQLVLLPKLLTPPPFTCRDPE